MDGTTKVKVILFVVVIAGMGLYNFLFVDQDEVGDFNNELVAMVQASDKAFAPAGKKIEALSNGQFDPASLPEAEKIAKIAKRQLQRISEMKVPPEELSQKFHAACVDYMKANIALAEAWHGGLKKVANAEGDDVGVAIAATLASCGTLAEACDKQFKHVQMCQRQLSNKYDIKLK